MDVVVRGLKPTVLINDGQGEFDAVDLPENLGRPGALALVGATVLNA